MGPASPSSPQGLKKNTAPAKKTFQQKQKLSLNEAFRNLGKRAVKAGRCLPQSDSSPRSKSPGRSEPTADLLQGNHPGLFRKPVSLAKAISAPGIPLQALQEIVRMESRRNLTSFLRKIASADQGALCPGASPDEASVGVQNEKDDFSGELNADSAFQGPQKLSSPQWSVRSSRRSATTEVQPTPMVPRCALSPA